MSAKGVKRFTLCVLSFVITLVFSSSPVLRAQDQVPDDEGEKANQIYLPFITGAEGRSVEVPSEQQALNLVAQQNNLSVADLTVLHTAERAYPTLGTTSHAFKVLDQQTGTLYGIMLDANGQAVDGTQLLDADQAIYAAQFGRLDPALAAVVDSVPNSETLRVVIWLKTPTYNGIERPAVAAGPEVAEVTAAEAAPLTGADLENQTLAESGIASATLLDQQIDGAADAEDAAAEETVTAAAPVDGATLQMQAQQEAFFAQVDAQRAAVVAQAALPLLDRLRTLAADSVTAEPYAPVLYAQLTPDAIRTVAAWPEVDAVYLDQIAQPTLNIARKTVYAHTVNNRGFTGAGIKVAQIEVGGLIATSNPYLAGVLQDYTYGCSNAHATWVAGSIRSTHSSVRGIAPRVTLWAGGSCNGLDSELQNRSTVAANWGALVVNLSLGADRNRATDSSARFYDDMVINRFRTVVIAAGNIGGAGCPQGTTGNVMSPGTAYNVITVGNFNDKNSTSWSGDVMNPCSSWRDPISAHGDREKPEIAAPGTNINTTSTAAPWTGDNVTGTSFSAPIVAGTAALLIQRNNNLANWPEAVKAILMATAVHNIEGSSRLSEYDGAGGLVAHYADDVARGKNGSWGAQNYTCSTAGTLNVATMQLTAGKRTRAVIVWDNDPAYSSYASQPGADLDLVVVNAAGTVVASSVSYDNTYEIVDFLPSANGNYTLRVLRPRCNYNPRFLGWAWFRN